MDSSWIIFWIFLKLTSAEVLECNLAMSFNALTNCRITTGSVSNGEELRISNAFNNITTLTFNQVNFEKVPKNIFAQYPKLTVLYISNNNLNQLSSSDFTNGKNLKTIFFYNNNLKMIPSKIFELCENAEQLTFATSPITDIQEEAFYGLKAVKSLSLQDLPLKNFPSTMLKDLPSLVTLKMENASLTSITKEFFAYNTKLQSLGFCDNSIEFIEKGTFEGLPSISSIDLSNNRLVSFSTENIPSVTIPSNSLLSLHIGSKTTSLVAEKNLLTNITCDETLSLRFLYLANNSLSRLPCVAKMTNLVDLQIWNNKFGKLNRKIFANLQNVTNFRSDGNPKFKLGSGMLSSFKKIFQLRIDNFVNGYRNLNTTLPKLTMITLSAKNWNCDRVKRVAAALNSQKIWLNFKTYYDDANSFLCNLTSAQVNNMN